jgi:hypothetical protein
MQTYRWVFAVGILLVLLGIAVLFQVDAAHDNPGMPQRARVTGAVASLQGCLMCHAAPEEIPTLAHGVKHAAIILPDMQSQPVKTAQQTAMQTRLLDAGQRILALPDSNPEQVEAVASGFWLAYGQFSAGSGEIAALDQLEYWLTILEYQAQTVRWNAASSASSQSHWAAWQTVSVSPIPAAVSEQVSLLDMGGTRPSRLFRSGEDGVTPAEIVFGVHRRGPPAAAQSTIV